MDDRKLETLLITIKEGSFSRAAEKLNCSQSAVTQLMNSMEDELGCTILTRRHSGVSLTREGELLLPYMIAADKSLAELRRQADYVNKGMTSPIRIGAFSSVVNQWLPDLIVDYQREYPQVSFDIRIGTSIMTDLLTSGDVDLAFVDESRCRGFRFYPLVEDIFYAAIPEEMAPEGDTISQEDFVELPFLMAPENTLEAHLNAMPPRCINVTCDDDQSLLFMVSRGLGVTAVPEMSLHHIPEGVKIMKIQPQMTRNMGIAIQPSAGKQALHFASYVREHGSDGTEHKSQASKHSSSHHDNHRGREVR